MPASGEPVATPFWRRPSFGAGIAGLVITFAIAISLKQTVGKTEEFQYSDFGAYYDAGRLVLCARGDGAGFLTPETSRGKAVAAAAFRRSTKELVDLAKEHPAFWNAVPGLVPGQLLASTGAVPISRDGRVIGAVGCGGGTGEQDHQCALAAAAAV